MAKSDKLFGFKPVETLPEGEVVVAMTVVEGQGMLYVATTRRLYALSLDDPEQKLLPVLFHVEEKTDGPPR